MNLIHHTRRTAIVAAVMASLAVSLGAASAAADGPDDSGDPAPTSVVVAEPAAETDDGRPEDPPTTSVLADPAAETEEADDDAPAPGSATPAAEAGPDKKPPGRGAAERPKPPDAVPTTVTAVAPSAPHSLTATAGNSLADLSWVAPSSDGGSPVDQYAVEKAIDPNGTWYPVATSQTTSYTASGLLNGATWYLRIKAHNATGWSPPSAVVSVMPFSTPGAPHTLQVHPSDGYVGLTWYEPPTGGRPIDNYKVERALSANGPWSEIGTTPNLSGGEGSLLNGKTYYYRVAAHNEAGWGPYSWTASAVPRTVPYAPYALKVLYEQPTSHLLVWTVPSDGGSPIDQYRVERATNPNGQWDVVGQPTTSSYKATGLKPGATYYYRVSAHNAAGWSTSSGVFSVKAPATKPSAPVYCSAVQVPAAPGWPNVLFKWNAPLDNGGAPITGYTIHIRRMGTGEYVKSIYTGVNTVRYDSLPTGWFDVYIWAENSVGSSQPCRITWVTVKL